MASGFKLNNGTILLSTEAPGGVYNSIQLKKIAALADQEAAVVKATEDQRLALFVDADKSEEIIKELEDIGLGIRNYQQGLHQPTACVGELCPEHLQDAMGAAIEMSDLLAGIDLATPLKIGINGCMNCCIATHTLDISVIGDSNGYRINLGGKNTQIPEMACYMAEGVPPEELGGLIKKVIECYKELSESGESLQEVMERAGSSAFIDALAPYSQDAVGGGDIFSEFSDQTELAVSQDDGSADMEEDSLSKIEDEEIDLESSEDLPAIDSLETEESQKEPDIDDLDLGDEAISQQFEETLSASGDFDELDDASLENDDEMVVLDDKLPSDELEDTDFEDIDEDVDEIDGEFDDLSESAILEDSSDINLEAEGADQDLDSDDDFLEASDIDEELGESFDDDEEDDIEESSMIDEPDKPSVTTNDESALEAEDELDEAFEADAVSEEEEEAFEEKLAATIDEEQSIGEIKDENAQERLAAVQLVEANIEDELDETDNLNHDSSQRFSGLNDMNDSWGFSGLDFSDDGKLIISFTSGAKLSFDLATIDMTEPKTYNLAGQVVTVQHVNGEFHVDIDGVGVYLPLAAA